MPIVLLFCFVFFIYTNNCVYFLKKESENAQEIQRDIEGRVVRFYRNGFEVLTHKGKYRVFLQRDQIFKLELFRAVGGEKEASKLQYFKSELEALKKLDRLVLYEKVLLKREGRVKATDSVFDFARGNVARVNARLVTHNSKDKSQSHLDSVDNSLWNYFLDWFVCFEKRIWKNIEERLSQRSTRFSKAVISGNSNFLSGSTDEEFKRCGLTHIIAVSGQHIAIIFGALIVFFRFLRVHKKIAIAFSLFLSLVVVIISGVAASALRSWIMVLVYVCTQALSRGSSLKDVLHFSFFILMTSNPLLLADLSFLLSFACLFSLVYMYPLAKSLSRHNELNIFNEAFVVFVSVQLFISPILALYFQQVPFLSGVSNVVVVPLTVPFLLSAFVIGISPVNWAVLPFKFLLEACTSVIMKTAEIFANLPLASVQMNVWTATAFSLVAILSIYVVKYMRIRLNFSKILRALAVLVLVLAVWSSYKDKFFLPERIVFFDVGQGSAALISSRNMKVLIDAGPPASTLNEKLSRYGAKHLQALIVSHYHLDHIGELPRIVNDESIEVKSVILKQEESAVSEAVVHALKRKTERIIFAPRGLTKMTMGENEFLIYSPGGSSKDIAVKNEMCLVVAVETRPNGISALFLADLPALEQKRLPFLNNRFEVVAVSHHGAKDGFLEELYARCKPLIAVISCGPNLYGHPSAEVVEGLKKLGITCLITHNTGDITLLP